MTACLLFDERDMHFMRNGFTLGANDRELLSQIEIGDIVLIYFDGKLNGELHLERYGSPSHLVRERRIRALCTVTERNVESVNEHQLELQDIYLSCWKFESPISLTRDICKSLRPKLPKDGPFDLHGDVKYRYICRFSLPALAELYARSPSEWPAWSKSILDILLAATPDEIEPALVSDAEPAAPAEAEVEQESPAEREGPKRRTVRRMVNTARQTASNANGQQVLRTIKNKELRFATADEFEIYVNMLIELQHGRCAITGLPLQFDEDYDDPEFLCSLDRIDSAGHYEAGNLQVVCRFINRWKNDDSDAAFRRLIGAIRAAGYSP